jgi:hypothetical protein
MGVRPTANSHGSTRSAAALNPRRSLAPTAPYTSAERRIPVCFRSRRESRMAVWDGRAYRRRSGCGADGTVYAGSWDGYLYAVGPDGNEKWRFQTGGGIDSSLSSTGMASFVSHRRIRAVRNRYGRGLGAERFSVAVFPGEHPQNRRITFGCPRSAATDIATGMGDVEPLAFSSTIQGRILSMRGCHWIFGSRECRVTLDVYSCTGRKVATLAGGTSAQAVIRCMGCIGNAERCLYRAYERRALLGDGEGRARQIERKCGGHRVIISAKKGQGCSV